MKEKNGHLPSRQFILFVGLTHSLIPSCSGGVDVGVSDGASELRRGASGRRQRETFCGARTVEAGTRMFFRVYQEHYSTFRPRDPPSRLFARRFVSLVVALHPVDVRHVEPRSLLLHGLLDLGRFETLPRQVEVFDEVGREQQNFLCRSDEGRDLQVREEVEQRL